MAPFRVALSADFRKADGSLAYPMFDLAPLRSDPAIEMDFVEAVEGAMPALALAEFDALILLGNRFTKASIPANGRLGIVARFGVGYDNVDVPACTDAGILLAITPDGVRRPVAVAIMTFILALSGRLMVKDGLTREGPAGFARRSAHMGVGLVGKTLGSLGIGNIGAEMFRLAQPFDMHFIAHDPYADPGVAAEVGVTLVDVEVLFRNADFLAVNCPLNDHTRHFINAERLALMKPSAFLINTARGPIVDQKALTQVLADGRIAGAGLDVLDKEPPDIDDPILKLDNVIFTPHALCWTDQCFAGIGAADVRAVLDYKNGRVPRGLVNREVLDAPAWKGRLAQTGSRQ
ncbi:MAG: dehydrogenase [Methylobacteriaceae bacterium]|nr:dehydrogenase [Methylobacteriaceae bacterium]MBV9247361.1 dehydrogenase [Methylobacteriaceae bacterium]MBV9704924.1 dehydrogenase [Methylobacteriaceae bacterium]